MSSPKVDLSKAVGFKAPPLKVVYNSRDLLLYSLSIGVHSDELHFLYENHPEFAAFPTYPLVLSFKRDNVSVSVYDTAGYQNIPGIPDFNYDSLVHGEQSLEIHRPLPVEGGSFELLGEVTGVFDKGSGMLIRRSMQLVRPGDNKPFVTMKASAFIIGAGGFGGPKETAKPPSFAPPKDRAPDHAVEDKITEDQAILYRLSGDYNPLHIDPAIAPRLGFKKPILHGLCTYGHAAHVIVKSYAGSDPNALKSITGKFTSPVYPGDTLVTKMWTVPSESKDQTTVIYQTSVKETGKIVINAGCVVLQNSARSVASKL
ncbi:hypothetical protein BGZ98_000022 [Dissophora globulifera]|nr:hypothetical protein BGZ98_000022 [Dissophora globulifera]